MKPRITYLTVGILAFVAGTAVSFFTLPIWVTTAINIAKEGNRSDWLGFFGSVIGAVMTLIAALVAWFAVQQQIRNTNQQLRATEKLRALERHNKAVDELKILNDAKEYLNALVSQFPQPSDSNYAVYNFAEQLRQLYQRAHVYVSESAATAPGEFGRRILKETWRIRTLAENAETRIKEGKMSFQDLSDEARLALEECRRIIFDIALENQRRQIQLTNFRDQVSSFS